MKASPAPSGARFFELPLESFPFLAELFPVGAPPDAPPVWSATITGPCVLRIPSFRPLGIIVRARVTFPDGRVVEEGP